MTTIDARAVLDGLDDPALQEPAATLLAALEEHGRVGAPSGGWPHVAAVHAINRVLADRGEPVALWTRRSGTTVLSLEWDDVLEFHGCRYSPSRGLLAVGRLLREVPPALRPLLRRLMTEAGRSRGLLAAELQQGAARLATRDEFKHWIFMLRAWLSYGGVEILRTPDGRYRLAGARDIAWNGTFDGLLHPARRLFPWERAVLERLAERPGARLGPELLSALPPSELEPGLRLTNAYNRMRYRLYPALLDTGPLELWTLTDRNVTAEPFEGRERWDAVVLATLRTAEPVNWRDAWTSMPEATRPPEAWPFALQARLPTGALTYVRFAGAALHLPNYTLLEKRR